MSQFLINKDEREALRGTPYLPQLVYLFAIRPFMDRNTGVVGLAKRITWQSLAEEVEVWPDRGIKREKPSKKQLERAVAWLVKRKLVEWDHKVNQKPGILVFKLPLAAIEGGLFGG